MSTNGTEVTPEVQQAQIEAGDEPQRIVTVRMPKSLHEALKSDAHKAETSLNQLCINRLQRLPDRGTRA
jgi:predicted HicB family RNase H-like nuclease